MSKEEVEIAETQEGTLPAPSIIGDYQFDHTTPNDGTTGITSHYYVKIQTTVPNEVRKWPEKSLMSHDL